MARPKGDTKPTGDRIHYDKNVTCKEATKYLGYKGKCTEDCPFDPCLEDMTYLEKRGYLRGLYEHKEMMI